MAQEQVETRIKKKILEFFDGGTLIFFITIFVYYYIGQKKKIEFDLLGIPSSYINFPFMDVIEGITFLLTSYLPLVVSLGLFSFMIQERWVYSKAPNSELYKKESILSARFKKSKILIFFLISLILCLNTSLENSSLSYMQGIFMTIFFTFSNYQVYRFILYIRGACKSTDQSYTLKRERRYISFFWIMIVFAIVHGVIIGMVYLESSSSYEVTVSQPVKELVKDEAGNLEHTEYRFKMLIKESNEYVIWRNAKIVIPEGDEKKEVDIEFSEILDYEPVHPLEVSQIKLNQTIEFLSEAPKNKLSFNNLEDVETQFNPFIQR